MEGTFREDDENQLAHIATDGETYGHHQKHADMALAYFLHLVEERDDSTLTIYGEFLEENPPDWEVQIIENTSWSCVHGVERWKSDCGCSTGMHSEWNQQWRGPLRETLDWLRDKMIDIYEKEAGRYTKDVWTLRDSYIKIILKREPENIKNVFAENGIKKLNKQDTIRLLKLLEMQRHAMLMYTSCGWFFDEISGIETVQVIQYAARAMQIVTELTGTDPEEEFVSRLSKAPSNIGGITDGAEVYHRHVKPAVIDLLRVAAHYAISSLFEDYGEESEIFCYEVIKNDYELLTAGRNKLALGHPTMRSKITLEEQQISFAVLYLGDHHFYGGVREWQNDDEYNTMCYEIKSAFDKLDIAEMILLMDKHFGTHSYNLWYLFKDKSREVFEKIMHQTLDSIEVSFRNVYKDHYATMQAMKHTGTPLPKALFTAIEYVVNADLKQVFEWPGAIDQDKLQNLLHEVRNWSVEPDKSTLSYVGSRRLNSLMEKLSENPEDFEIFNELNNSLWILKELEIDLNMWEAQNILFSLIKKNHQKFIDENSDGKDENREWINRINELQKKLEVNIRFDKFTGSDIQTAV